MKEYIDRFAILKKSENMFDGQRYCTAINTRHVYAMPTADVVEVVRCKDCEYYEDGVCNLHSEYEDKYTRGYTIHMNDDDFCSYGERKTMGQHKHNPNCQLAKEGKLPPKQKRKSRSEVEKELYALCSGYIARRFMDAYSKMNGGKENG